MDGHRNRPELPSYFTRSAETRARMDTRPIPSLAPLRQSLIPTTSALDFRGAIRIVEVGRVTGWRRASRSAEAPMYFSDDGHVVATVDARGRWHKLAYY